MPHENTILAILAHPCRPVWVLILFDRYEIKSHIGSRWPYLHHGNRPADEGVPGYDAQTMPETCRIAMALRRAGVLAVRFGPQVAVEKISLQMHLPSPE
jgi:hypothetical protein